MLIYFMEFNTYKFLLAQANLTQNTSLQRTMEHCSSSMPDNFEDSIAGLTRLLTKKGNRILSKTSRKWCNSVYYNIGPIEGNTKNIVYNDASLWWMWLCFTNSEYILMLFVVQLIFIKWLYGIDSNQPRTDSIRSKKRSFEYMDSTIVLLFENKDPSGTGNLGQNMP